MRLYETLTSTANMERKKLLYQNGVPMGATCCHSYILDMPFNFIIADLIDCPASVRASTNTVSV